MVPLVAVAASGGGGGGLNYRWSARQVASTTARPSPAPSAPDQGRKERRCLRRQWRHEADAVS